MTLESAFMHFGNRAIKKYRQNSLRSNQIINKRVESIKFGNLTKKCALRKSEEEKRKKSIFSTLGCRKSVV